MNPFAKPPGMLLIRLMAMAIILVACGKEKDRIVPTIHLVMPSSEIIIDIPDSVRIVADIYDNERIESMKIALLNTDRISVSDPRLFYPAGNSFHLDFHFHVNESYLVSGDYIILIWVFDGTNTAAQYIPVQLVERPKELQGFVVAGSPGPGVTRLDYLDTAFGNDTIVLLPEKYAISGVNPRYGMLYLVTPEPSKILAYPWKDPEAEWSARAILPFAEFTCLHVDQDLLLGTANGDIFVYHPQGNGIVNTQQQTDRKVLDISANNDFIVSEIVSIDGTDHFLNTYYRISGGLHRSRLIQGDVSAIVPVDDLFLVFIVVTGNTRIFELEPVENVMTMMDKLDDEVVLTAIGADPGIFLLRTGEGIYTYDLLLNRVSLFIHGPCRGIVFEPLQSVLYVYGGYLLRAYRYPEGDLLEQFTFTHEILTLHPLYNK